jgi:hypothetical protein
MKNTSSFGRTRVGKRPPIVRFSEDLDLDEETFAIIRVLEKDPKCTIFEGLGRRNFRDHTQCWKETPSVVRL